MTGPLVTARQVAELLGVAPATVLRWTRRGDLPALKLPGGAVRYRPDELERWLAERATTRADDAPEESSNRSARHPPHGSVHACRIARTEEDTHAR